MRFAAAIRQRWERSWRKAAGTALTIALLSAVVVVAIWLFGSEVFAAWKTPGNAEQNFVSDGAFEGLFSFDAPAQTIFRANAQTQLADANNRRANLAYVLVNNWKYTQSPLADQLLQSAGQFLLAYEASLANFVNQLNQLAAAEFSAFAALVNAALAFYASLVNAFASIFVNTSTTITNSNTHNSSSSSHSASPFR